MLYSVAFKLLSQFDRPAGGGRQLLRVIPLAIAGQQQLRRVTVTITPKPLEQNRFRDFFGTEVVEVVLPAHLTRLEVEMRAEVERQLHGPGFDVSPTRRDLADLLAAERFLGPDSPHHFLPLSPRIPVVPAISAFAQAATQGADSLVAVIEQLGLALHKTMVFDSQATEVDTPIEIAFAGRRGVCQDFAQIMIAGLRSLGLPAAYVAGYLRTLPPAGQPRLQGVDAMHAWVRVWAGPQLGWVEYDATNACWVDGDHIVVGYGRDYSDVAPVTGAWRLDGAQSGMHIVDIAEI